MDHDEPTNPGIGHVLRAIEAKDAKDAIRHKAVEALANELAVHREEIVGLKGRVTKLESNSTDSLKWPAWSLVAAVIVGESALIALQLSHMWSVL